MEQSGPYYIFLQVDVMQAVADHLCEVEGFLWLSGDTHYRIPPSAKALVIHPKDRRIRFSSDGVITLPGAKEISLSDVPPSTEEWEF